MNTSSIIPSGSPPGEKVDDQHAAPGAGRRKFIKSTGAVVIGGAVASALGLPRALGGDRQTLKVGLVGCGGRGTGAAAQALQADPDVTLTAMADTFRDHLDKSYAAIRSELSSKVQVDEGHKFVGFDAYRKLIESDVDVVILATPPAFRPDHLVAAIGAGKHVFCEKPMAVDAPGVRKVLQAAKAAREKKLSLVSGFCYRYYAPNRALIERMRQGEIGDIKALSTTRNGGELWYFDRQPNWTEMEYQMRNWYYYNWLSGDHIVEQAVHSIDLMAWIMGDVMPLRATGSGGRQVRVDKKYGNIYDHFAIEFEYANDVKGYHFCRQQNGCSTGNTVEVFGTQGKATIDFWHKTHGITGKKTWVYDGEVNDMYQTEHNEFFASIRKGEPMNDGEWMAGSTMMAILGRMVAYTGQTITWDEALNSEVKIGPAFDEYDWKLQYPVSPVATPGLTKSF